MKRVFVIVLLVLVSISTARAEKPLGVEEFNSVDELAGAIAAHFPKVQGEVSAVQGDKVTVTLGGKDGITSGMTLTLWRVAKEVLHPVTNAVIGRTEEEVGTMEVSSPGENSSTGVMVKKLKDPKPGDKARITPRKINLAVIPLNADSTEVVAELDQRLNETGRFSVLEAEKTAAFLKERKVRDSAMVREMGRAHNLDAVVALSAYPTEGRLLVAARIFYADDARLLDTVVALLASKARPESVAEIKPFFTPAKEEKAETADLPFRAKLFTTADLDGDGSMEYAFSDGVRLHVYRQEPAGWKEVWTETLRGVSVDDIQHISLDAADINANGRPELFVTAMIRETVVSYVTEWQDGAYRRIADAPGFLRLLSYPGRGPVLIGQDYDPVKFYDGQPKEYAWSGGKYVPGAPFPLPRGVGLYGFTFADFGEQRLFLVAIDEDDKLVVYSGDARIWKSEEEYSGVDTIVVKPLTGIDTVTKAAGETDKTRQVRIKGRVLAMDLDGDRKQEIILPKHLGGFLILGPREAELHGLRWTGARLDSIWSVKDISGTVQDIAPSRQSDGAAQVRALVRSSGGLFTKDMERVIMFTVK